MPTRVGVLGTIIVVASCFSCFVTCCHTDDTDSPLDTRSAMICWTFSEKRAMVVGWLVSARGRMRVEMFEKMLDESNAGLYLRRCFCRR